MKKITWDENTALKYGISRTTTNSTLTVVYPQLKGLELFKPNTQILSIGSGTGLMEIAAAVEYQANLTIVEPSLTLINVFEQEARRQNVEKQISSIAQKDFKNFTTDRNFDLVIAVHCWHYIGYDLPQFKKAISMLNKNARFCIVLTSNKAFSKSLKDLLYPQGHSFIDYQELSIWAKENAITHTLYHGHKKIPLKKFLMDDEFTEYGRSWLSLMGRKEWDDLGSETKLKAKVILQQFAVDGQLDDAWGAILINHPHKN